MDANGISRKYIAAQTETTYRGSIFGTQQISDLRYEYTLFGISERVWLLASGLALAVWVLL
jgi:hypothetical protein